MQTMKAAWGWFGGVTTIEGKTVASLAAIALALVSGCSVGAVGPQDEVTSPSTSGPPASGSPAGRCTGRAVDASRMNDIGSCQAQGGDWHRPTPNNFWCESSPYSDQCGSMTRSSSPGPRGDYGKADCVRVLGCAWENPDGSLERNPLLGGTCSGEPTPCHQFKGLLQCEAETGCSWNSSSSPSSCVSSGSRREACSSYSTATEATPEASVHPERTKFQCISRGCTFTRADGTVETN